MKKLNLQSIHYNYLEKSFGEWLDVLGYAEKTIKNYPLRVREMLYFFEQKQIAHITQVKPGEVYSFIKHIKQRRNEQTGAALSSSHINGCIGAINLFAKYLQVTAKHTLDITPRREEMNTEERIILTREEIMQLYEATFIKERENTLAMGQRDRAMIAVFYGCGLRKDEGTRLNITDIKPEKALLFVGKGKGNKQRYVPIATKHLQDIRDYLEEGRNWFLEHHTSSTFYKKPVKKKNTDDEAFFINQKGRRLQVFYDRLKKLRERTDIDKDFSLHNLRHSIATHLLQSGMDIEEISKFLGHSSLESTQIYTHIVNEEQARARLLPLLD